jgi:hypothetical protein
MTFNEAALTTDPQTNESVMQIPLDAEHSGIRTAGCLSFLVLVPITFVIFNMLIPTIPVLAGILSLPMGVGASYLIEQTLRKRWPSGRVFVASATDLTIRKHAENQVTIDPTQTVNVLSWHFSVPRNGRVKKGWQVIGLAFEQDDEILPLYTFASPENFEKMPFSARFMKLERKKDKDDQVTKSASSMRMAGQQRRLYEAEQHRGMNGGEMTFEQFTDLLQYLHKQYPEWMDS